MKNKEEKIDFNKGKITHIEWGGLKIPIEHPIAKNYKKEKMKGENNA